MSDLPTLGPIHLTGTSDDFLNGYQVGLARYQLDNAKRALTDREVYETLAGILFDTHNTDRYRAGVVAGWFAGLYAHCMQLGCTLPTLAVVSAEPMRHVFPRTTGKAHHMAPLMQEG